VENKGNIYSECVSVASGVQDAERLRPIILSSVACLAMHIILKTARFSESGTADTIYVAIFSTTLLKTFLILRRTERVITNIFV
jgi:multidrug efflux pump subunit AcrB